MDLKPLSYNGRDEGIEVSLKTELRPGDDAVNIAAAIHTLFPDASVKEFSNQSFPSQQYDEIECSHLSFDIFLEQLRKQSILDTAMDAMGIHLEGNQTKFNVSRLAAFAGKIAFTYEDEPLGVILKFVSKAWGYPIGLKPALGIMGVKMFRDNSMMMQQWIKLVKHPLGIIESH